MQNWINQYWTVIRLKLITDVTWCIPKNWLVICYDEDMNGLVKKTDKERMLLSNETAMQGVKLIFYEGKNFD